jgi:hypothetical protein
MSIGPGQFLSAAVGWAQEWQRLRLTATNTAIAHYLRGCASIVMAHTPQQALVELHKMQARLLGHWVGTIAEATKLCRKQNAKLLRL